MEETTQQVFLLLVRIGIGHWVDDLPESIDWEALRALAQEQGLDAIVLDGIVALSNRGDLIGAMALDRPLKMQWIHSVIRNYEDNYKVYQKRIGELAGFYNAHGFRLMVLKGYGLSLNYPVPNHRPCGDIDIWAFGQYMKADAALSRELGIPIEQEHHHHTVFCFNEYKVENHYAFLDVHYSNRYHKLEEILKKQAENDSCFIEIDGQNVYLPSANLHALFMLQHALSHFFAAKMILRQVLDWGFFIEKHGAEIDWDWMRNVMLDYRMTNFFQCLNAICVEDLGFDNNDFPEIQFDEQLRKRVLNDILSPELYSPPPESRFCRLFFKLRRWQAKAWKHDLCYDGGRFNVFLRGIWSHLINPSSI